MGSLHKIPLSNFWVTGNRFSFFKAFPYFKIKYRHNIIKYLKCQQTCGRNIFLYRGVASFFQLAGQQKGFQRPVALERVSEEGVGEASIIPPRSQKQAGNKKRSKMFQRISGKMNNQHNALNRTILNLEFDSMQN